MPEFVDPYFDPATGVLRNKLEITSQSELDHVETEFSESRALDLADEPVIFTGDLAHLQAIHQALFQDVYDWAGQLRTVDIIKSGDGNSFFLPVAMIHRAAAYQFGQLAEEDHLQGLDYEQFVRRLAYHVNEVNYIHPFREGNGRTARVFWTQVAHRAGYEIDWTGISPEQNMAAYRQAMATTDPAPIAALLEQAVSPLVGELGRRSAGGARQSRPAVPTAMRQSRLSFPLPPIAEVRSNSPAAAEASSEPKERGRDRGTGR